MKVKKGLCQIGSHLNGVSRQDKNAENMEVILIKTKSIRKVSEINEKQC